MKRKIGWYGLVAGTLLLGWLVSPLSAQVKKFAYLSVAQTWTALQTFSSGITSGTIYDSGAAGPTVSISGDTALGADYSTAGSFSLLDATVDLTISEPADAPTFEETSGFGTCSNAGSKTYKFALVWYNASGNTDVGTASTVYTPSGTTKRATVTRSESLPTGADAWAVAWADSTTSYATWKLCATGSVWENSASTTYICGCASGGSEISANTTGALTVASLFNGELRSPSPEANSDADYPVLTAGGYRLAFSGAAPTYSSDSGVTSVPISVLNGQVLKVCSVGCEYTTIAAAVTAITDASATKRYTILVEPGEYATEVTLPDYTTIIGRGGTSSRVGNIIVPGGFNEVAVLGLYITGVNGIYCADGTNNSGRLYVIGNIIGSIEDPIGDLTVDTIWNCDATSEVYDIANIHNSTWDMLTASADATVYASGSIYRVRPVDNSTAQSQASAFRVLAGSRFYGNGLIVDIDASENDYDSAILTGVSFQVPNSGTAYAATVFKLRNSTINIRNTSATWNDTAACWEEEGYSVANGFGSISADMSGTVCNITITSTSGTLAGIYLTDRGSDSDWGDSAHTYTWRSGEIVLSGGANRYTVFVGVGSPANTTFVLGPSLYHPATFSITGSATVSYSNGFMRSADLAAGSCLANEIAFDTVGTQEICFCNSATWTCVSATTTSGPTD